MSPDRPGSFCFRIRVGISALTLGLLLTAVTVESALAEDYALTVYAGKITEDRWFESFFTKPDFVDAYIIAGALAWTFESYNEGSITLEIEGQVGKYYGDQHHFEFNIPLAVRLHRFPWDNSMDTSIAFGLGPSWASELPEAELQFHDSTQRFLAYWFLEFTAGPPGKGWAGVFRLHHRSKAFGLVADDGGANILTLGMKYFF
jgi:hypothetical protein